MIFGISMMSMAIKRPSLDRGISTDGTIALRKNDTDIARSVFLTTSLNWMITFRHPVTAAPTSLSFAKVIWPLVKEDAGELFLLLENVFFSSQSWRSLSFFSTIFYFTFILILRLCLFHSYLREAIMKKSAVFFNIVQKAFDPPPIHLNIMWWIFLKEF